MSKQTLTVLIVLVLALIGYFGYAMWYNKKQKDFIDYVQNGNGNGKAPGAGDPLMETRPVLVSGTGNEDMASGEMDLEVFVPVGDVNVMII